MSRRARSFSVYFQSKSACSLHAPKTCLGAPPSDRFCCAFRGERSGVCLTHGVTRSRSKRLPLSTFSLLIASGARKRCSKSNGERRRTDGKAGASPGAAPEPPPARTTRSDADRPSGGAPPERSPRAHFGQPQSWDRRRLFVSTASRSTTWSSVIERPIQSTRAGTLCLDLSPSVSSRRHHGVRSSSRRRHAHAQGATDRRQRPVLRVHHRADDLYHRAEGERSAPAPQLHRALSVSVARRKRRRGFASRDSLRQTFGRSMPLACEATRAIRFRPQHARARATRGPTT
jgi:hypothetical protein